MNSELIRDHYLGAFYGLAIGDALGSQYEGETSSSIRMRLGDRRLRLEKTPRRKLETGQWGDDTVQFMAAVESLNLCKGFEGLDMAGNLVKVFEEDATGLDFFTRQILRDLDRDLENWASASRTHWVRGAGTAAGDSALTRCMAAGLFFSSDIHKMVETTICVSHLTHFDPRCVESALVLNFVLLQCVHRRFVEGIAEQALAFLKATRSTPAYKNLALNYKKSDLIEYTNFSPFPPYPEDQNAVPDAIRALKSARPESLKNTGQSMHTMASSLWCVTHHENFEDALSTAIKLGGKTDTQGAVTGALAGARFGLSAIPREWIGGIQQSSRIMSAGEVFIGNAMAHEERDFIEGRRDPIRRPPPVI